MRRTLATLALVCASNVGMIFQTPVHANDLKSFKTDGCSGGMSAAFRLLYNRQTPWEACCVAHDQLYWPGGTSDQRVEADRGLYTCVKASGHPLWAAAMWASVRLGGTPFFPFDWRWGYGRDFGTSYWYDRPSAGADR